MFEAQTQAAHDLGDLLHLKTEQINRYGHILGHISSFYCQY